MRPLWIGFCVGLVLAGGCSPPAAVSPSEEPTTPAALGRNFFRALQFQDRAAMLATIAPDDVWAKLLQGDSDLPLILQMQKALRENFRIGFDQFRLAAKEHRFAWRTARLLRVNVEERPEREGLPPTFGVLTIEFECPEHPGDVFEIEMDDGVKLDGRWYFTDYIRDFRKKT